MNFNELYWHDSVINNIEINRNNPGKNDVIIFEIDWYDSGKSKLIFEDVYWARLDLNFGVVSSEYIDSAFVAENNDIDLGNFYKKWSKLNFDIKLNCYVIKTSSTGSEIKIIAKCFKIVD